MAKNKASAQYFTVIVDKDLVAQIKRKAESIGFNQSQITRGLLLGWLAGLCDPFAHVAAGGNNGKGRADS